MHEQQNLFDTGQPDITPREAPNNFVEANGNEKCHGIPFTRHPYDPNERRVSEAAEDQGHRPYVLGVIPPNLNLTDKPAPDTATDSPKQLTPVGLTPKGGAIAQDAIAEMRAILKANKAPRPIGRGTHNKLF